MLAGLGGALDCSSIGTEAVMQHCTATALLLVLQATAEMDHMLDAFLRWESAVRWGASYWQIRRALHLHSQHLTAGCVPLQGCTGGVRLLVRRHRPPHRPGAARPARLTVERGGG